MDDQGMTVDEMIASLSALPPEVRALPAFVSHIVGDLHFCQPLTIYDPPVKPRFGPQYGNIIAAGFVVVGEMPDHVFTSPQ